MNEINRVKQFGEISRSNFYISKYRPLFYVNFNKVFYFLFAVFTVMVMFEPQYISVAFPSIHQLFELFKYADAALIVLLSFINKSKFDSSLFWFLGLQITLLFTTLAFSKSGNTSLSAWFSYAVFPILLQLFLKMLLKIDYKIIINSFSLVLGSFVLINIFCWFLFPSGMYVDSDVGYTENWFLGYDNVATVTIVLAQMISAYRISANAFKFKLWDVLVIAAGLFFIFVQEVATGILAEILFFAIMFFSRFKLINKSIFKAKYAVIAFLILFFIIQFVSYSESSVFSFLLNLLNKNSTFYARVLLWKNAWKDLLPSSIFLGFGILSWNYLTKHFGYWAFHMHCYYMQVLYEGGLLSFFVLIGFLLNCANRFDRAEKSHVSGIFFGAMAAFLLMWQVEAYINLIRYSVVVFFFIYNVSLFDRPEITQRLNKPRIKLTFNGRNRLYD